VDELCREAAKLAEAAPLTFPLGIEPSCDRSHQSRPASNAARGIRPKWAFSSACAALVLVSIFAPLPFRLGLAADASSRVAHQNQDDAEMAKLRDLRVRQASAVGPARVELSRRHANICVLLGERAWKAWYGGDEELWLDRFSAANQDLRLALRWLGENEPDR